MAITLSDIKTETEAGGQVLVSGTATFGSSYATGGEVMDLSAYIFASDTPHVVADRTVVYSAHHDGGTAASGKLIAIKIGVAEENANTNLAAVSVFFFARGDPPPAPISLSGLAIANGFAAGNLTLDQPDPDTTTVEKDLDNPEGPERRLLLTLDGHEPILWQLHPDGCPAAYTIGGSSRSGHNCLRTPTEEVSGGVLDVRSCLLTPGGCNFGLEDFESPAGVLYFARLFAPGRWTTADVGDLGERTPGDDATYQVDADSATIPVGTGIGDLPASGTAYIGQETFTYSGKTATDLTGCSRGLCPSFGTDPNRGATYIRPASTDIHDVVSTYPFNWLGRRVALHVTTWDEDNQEWKPDPVLLYVGVISEEVSWDPARCCWLLSTRSILEDLKRDICRAEVRPWGKAHLDRINLAGASGLQWKIWEIHSGANPGPVGTFDLSPNVYTSAATLLTDVNTELNDSGNWVGTPDVAFREVDGQIVATNMSDSDDRTIVLVLLSDCPRPLTWPDLSLSSDCHVWRAVGTEVADGAKFVMFTCPKATEAGGYGAYVPLTGELCEAYSPLDDLYNGGVLYLDDASDFFPDQGDEADYSRAWVTIADANVTIEGEPQTVRWAYDDVTGAYTLSRAFATGQVVTFTGQSFVRQKAGEDPVEVNQVYVPTVRPRYISTPPPRLVRGPFELLLHTLCSTGTPGYGHADFDCLPLSCSCAMPADLVDTESFLAADEALWADTNLAKLADRKGSVIGPDAISWTDLLQRECQTFGYVLAWDIAKAKLSLKPIWRDMDYNEYLAAVELGYISAGKSTDYDGSLAAAKANPATVINQWTIKAGWNPLTEKEVYELTVDDNNSIIGVRDKRAVEIEHPGIYCPSDSYTGEQVRAWLFAALTGEQKKALPWWTIEEQLAPHFFRKVSTGDRIRYDNRHIPDQFGAGTIGCTSIALVLDRGSNFDLFTGRVTLLLYAEDITPLEHGGHF